MNARTERVVCHRNAWLSGHGRRRGQTQPPKSYEPPNHQHRLFRRATDSPKYSCEGSDISPPLDWTNAPANTKSFALIMDDPDAPVGTWVHWVLYDLPANTTGLPEDVAKTQVIAGGAKQGLNSLAAPGLWRAVSAARQAASLLFQTLRARHDARPQARRDEEGLVKAMEGHVLAEGQLMGTYQTEMKRDAT